jgi:hypothetical protein
LKDPNFRRGRYSTAFIDRLLAATQPLVPAAKTEEQTLKTQAA